MLGRQEPRHAEPHGPHGVPGQRHLRLARPLPGVPPGAGAAAHVRDGLGHASVQRPGGLARGRLAAVRLEFRRPVS